MQAPLPEQGWDPGRGWFVLVWFIFAPSYYFKSIHVFMLKVDFLLTTYIWVIVFLIHSNNFYMYLEHWHSKRYTFILLD